MHSKILDKKIIEEYISKKYPSIKSVNKIKYIEHNNINSENFVFNDNKFKYILKFVKEKSSPDKIEKIGKILEFCKNNDCKVYVPIKNNQNQFFDKKQKAYITKFVEGNHFQGTKKELKDVAKNIAIFHKVISQYPIRFNYRTNDLFLKILKHKELTEIEKILRNKQNFENFDKKVIKYLKYIKSQIQKNKKFSRDLKKLNLRKQLIHYDLHTQNIIFKNYQVEGIIDFASMRKGFLMEDIAFSCFKFVSIISKDKFRIKKNIKLFLNEYSKNNTIQENEIEFFYLFLRRKFLTKISYILKKRYFSETNSWLEDFEKYVQNLKLIEKLE